MNRGKFSQRRFWENSLNPAETLANRGILVFGAFCALEHLTTVRSLRNFVRFLVAVQLLPALESGEETLVGGQAVLEGVMMRSPHAWAIACRKPSGEVVTMSEPLARPSEKHKWMAWPIVRGVMTLGYAMSLGYRALRFSANVAIEEVMQSDKEHVETAASAVPPKLAPSASSGQALSLPNGRSEAEATDASKSKSREKAAAISGWLAAVNVIISLAFFIFMYKYLPLLAATELKKANPALGGQIVFNLVDGAIRLLLFLLFIWGVSLFPDIRRVYQYHGAEHKTVFAFENGDPLETSRGAEIFHVPSALRHQLSDDGDADLDRLLHAGSVHHVLGAFRIAHRAAARDRRSVLRNHPLRRQASRLALRPDDRSRPLAATHHDPAAVGRNGPMRHHRARSGHGPGKRTRRRIGDCLGFPTRETVVGRLSLVVGLSATQHYSCLREVSTCQHLSRICEFGKKR